MTYYAIIRVNLLAGNRKVDDDSQKPFRQNCSMKSFEDLQLSFLSRWNTFLANTFYNLSRENNIVPSLSMMSIFSPSSKVCPSFVRRQFFILGRNCKFRGYLLRDTVFFSALWDLSREISLKGEEKSSVEWSFFLTRTEYVSSIRMKDCVVCGFYLNINCVQSRALIVL